MDGAGLRAWWAHRQGLDGSLDDADPAEVLESSGWARSVGGCGPYLTLHARARSSRLDVDTAVAGLAIHELPSARGCTYVVPAAHYATALTVAQPSARAELNVTRKLGVDDAEIESLCVAVLDVVADDQLDPAAMKDRLGDAVRDLGAAGKARGLNTTLPVALALLQARGDLRRVPINGRLDQQRYRYTRWSPAPLATKAAPTLEEARTELVRLFLGWAGPASIGHVRWFTGFTAAATKAALAALDVVVVPVDGRDDVLLLADDLPAFQSFDPPTEPQVSLLAGIDGLFLLRRQPADLIAAASEHHPLLATGSRGLFDLPSHAIVDRGELVGLWEFDVDAGAIVWATFDRPSEDVHSAVKATESFVRDDLGDARSFSLDSPSSRRPRVEALRAHQA